MSNVGPRVPKYALHKASGQAVVTLNGRDVYLGPYGSAASRAKYDRTVGEWLAAGRRTAEASRAVTVDDVIAAYWQFAETYYRKQGEPTGELDNLRHALRPLHQLYGPTEANTFSPRGLKALQQRWIEQDISRGVINQRIGILKRMFRWAVAEELVAVTVHQALTTVAGLKQGRSAARETAPVLPVAEDVFQATLPHLPAVIRDIVLLQRYCGCRPSEALLIRPGEVERNGAVWIYRPTRHKTEHRGRGRQIMLGPRAQAVLLPYLDREPEAYCFSPREAVAQRARRLRAQRKTKVQPSQRDRRKARPRRPPGDHYEHHTYARAIRRACEKAGVPPWCPNQLRHAAATAIRAQYGLEGAQVVLGHSRADVTQIYAERDWLKAQQIAAEAG
ncbi:MAG: site-specific integrase [Pirellulales bacterium]|nr:site-specific integrase [Pirellulales bacterium]